MKTINPIENSFSKLTNAVEVGDPMAAKMIKEKLDKSDDPSQMRYLEGLLLLLGETPGELEDPPDYEDDPEEYWEEY